jgi:hypothetical protein
MIAQAEITYKRNLEKRVSPAQPTEQRKTLDPFNFEAGDPDSFAFINPPLGVSVTVADLRN